MEDAGVSGAFLFLFGIPGLFLLGLGILLRLFERNDDDGKRRTKKMMQMGAYIFAGTCLYALFEAVLKGVLIK